MILELIFSDCESRRTFRCVKAANDVHRLGHAEAALNQYFPVDDTMPSTYNGERNKYASRPCHGKVRAFKLPD